MSEEFFFTPETKTSVVLKTNADIIQYLSHSPIANDAGVKTMIQNHSDFILGVSSKVINAERLDFKSVK